MKRIAKRALSMLLAICMVFTLLPVTALAAGTDDMVRIAKAEVGTSGSPNKYTRWNGSINGSYDYWWCAAFVSWVANQAGESAAIPKTASVYVMTNGILNAGGKRVTSPQAGDIVVYRRIADNYYAHVGIMENGTTSIEGNYGNAVCRGIRPNTYSDGAGSSVANGRIEVIYLRPKYKITSSSVTVKSYFDCNVKIATTKGTRVNLYSKPTDSSSKAYFDQGQIANSTRGAKLSNGTTWYEFQALDENNKVVTLWINGAASGVKVTSIVEPSLSFSTGSVSVDVGGSKTVAVKYAGDDVETVGGIIEGKSLCDVAWENINQSAGTADLVITGKKTGDTTITLNLMDKNGKTLCSKSLGVTVNSLGYTVTYNANGGTGAPAAQTKDYGKALTLSATKPTRAGYIFTGWAETPTASHVPYQPGSSFPEDRNLTLYAIWMADPYMRYQVKHYKENLDGSYTLADTDNRFGVTSVSVYPPVRSYEGFVSPAVQTATVPTVQDTVLVNYYYKRQSYHLAVNAGEGIQVSGGGEYRYGQSVTVTAKVGEGYEWSGWSSDVSLSNINPKVTQITFPMPAANVTLTASAAKKVHQHDLTHVAAKAATETSTGNIEYWQCSGCGKYYADGNAMREISLQQTVIATIQHVHSLTHIPAKAATETTEGNIEYWQCNGCGKCFVDKNTAQEISLSQTILQRIEHVHTLREHQSVPSTCTQSGCMAYWTCESCGKAFADAAGNHEVTISQLTLAPLGHNYVSGACTRDGARDPNYNSNTDSGFDNAPVSEVHLPKQATYTQGHFTDVYPNQWFTEVVAEAYELGLMQGKAARVFDPYGSVTVAETITMACRIHSIYTKGYEDIPQSEGTWYQGYLDYAYANNIVSWSDYNSSNVSGVATRAQFAQIMAKALPEAGFSAFNPVADGAIPDVSMSAGYAPAVYKLYRAGILSGGDVNGTFFPQTYITRAESAAVVARIADSGNRVQFSLA